MAIRIAGLLAFFVGVIGVVSAKDAAVSPIGRKIEDFTLHDYLGAEFSLKDWSDKQAVVIVFLGTECPLVKLYGSRLAELAEFYADQGVQFVGINANRQDTLEEIGHYAREHKIEFPILKDPGNHVADEFGAQRTPEAFVLDRDMAVRYWGRIDDQYGVGYAKSDLSQSDLSNALDEVLAGKPVSTPVTKAVGCFIGRAKEQPATGDITYTKHIAGVFNEHCVRCHRGGEVAPFSLTSYDDVIGWGDTIAEVIHDGRMPPWHANPAHGTFSNDSRLPDDKRQLVYDWVKNGMPEGDAADLPPAPEFVEGWQIGKPDVVYEMPATYDVPARGVVDYQYFIIEKKVEEDIWVRAAELRPGNRAVVHHLIFFYVPPGHEHHRGTDALFHGIATFAPGMPPMDLPEGLARRIPAGSRLVFQAHYTPNGTAQTDRSQVGLILADPAEVKRELKNEAGMNFRLLIPPGERDYRVETKKRIKEDSLLYTLMPHMHYRGKSFRFTAHYPDGGEEILLDVPRYDFNWQNVYKLAEPKLLPAETEIHMEAHYDNSAENPLNPDPASPVRWGDQTWEEMMIGSMSLSSVDEDLANKSESSEKSESGGE